MENLSVAATVGVHKMGRDNDAIYSRLLFYDGVRANLVMQKLLTECTGSNGGPLENCVAWAELYCT